MLCEPAINRTHSAHTHSHTNTHTLTRTHAPHTRTHTASRRTTLNPLSFLCQIRCQIGTCVKHTNPPHTHTHTASRRNHCEPPPGTTTTTTAATPRFDTAERLAGPSPAISVMKTTDPPSLRLRPPRCSAAVKVICPRVGICACKRKAQGGRELFALRNPICAVEENGLLVQPRSSAVKDHVKLRHQGRKSPDH